MTPISEWGSRGDFLRAIFVSEMASEESREKLRRGQDAGLGWAGLGGWAALFSTPVVLSTFFYNAVSV